MRPWRRSAIRWAATRCSSGWEKGAPIFPCVPPSQSPFRSCSTTPHGGCNRAFHGFISFNLLRALKRGYRAKFRHRSDGPVTLAELATIRDFYGFDDRITAPLHGYAGVHDYYARASCRPDLRRIRTPTLILHALDDPFMWPETAPATSELSPSVRLELSSGGGHVGFVAGPWPWQAEYWLERRIPAFLAQHW